VCSDESWFDLFMQLLSEMFGSDAFKRENWLMRVRFFFY
jgi:hypothetical protein